MIQQGSTHSNPLFFKCCLLSLFQVSVNIINLEILDLLFLFGKYSLLVQIMRYFLTQFILVFPVHGIYMQVFLSIQKIVVNRSFEDFLFLIRYLLNFHLLNCIHFLFR